MTAYDVFVGPFIEFAFMKRALVVCVVLSLSAAPLGYFMMLRRMTLVGDAMSHAILPGVAIAALLGGVSLGAMTLGGILMGALVALAAMFLIERTHLSEDASFSLVYLLSLSAGIMLMSGFNRNIDLLHILFGNILGVDDQALRLVAAISGLTVLFVALFYRRLVLDSFDASLLARRGKKNWTGFFFAAFLMLNLVAAFQALGTLMALGLMILPSLSARFWSRNIDHALPICLLVGVGGSYGGLLLSFHLNTLSGPSLVCVLGGIAVLSALLGPVGSVRATKA